MYNRRDFIKTVLAGSVFLALPAAVNAFSGKKPIKLVILHTNDVHSHIDQFPADDPDFANMGGFARRSALINKIRSENEHVLLFDCGDIFQGTPYFNYFGGKLDFELMSKMKYDAATIGNHEFDNGIDWLVDKLQYADFPFVNSNFDVSETPLNDKIKKWIIIEKGDLRIGVIGLGINPVGLIKESNYKGLIYKDPVIEGDVTAQLLKQKMNCNFVIALSHLGLDMGQIIDDKKLAAQTQYIDVILSGHTHTFMKEPVIIENAVNEPVVIQQAGMGGVCLGRLDFTFSKDKAKMNSKMYDLK